jgi:hypothetical protein
MNKHRIDIKEDKNGWFAVTLNSRVIAYGLEKEQASKLIDGIAIGIQETGQHHEYSDNYYAVFSV